MEIKGIEITRRRLLMAVSIGAGSLVGADAALPMIGFFLGPIYLKFRPVWLKGCQCCCGAIGSHGRRLFSTRDSNLICAVWFIQAVPL